MARHMVFAIGKMQFETFECKACTQRETCSVSTLIVNVDGCNGHLAGTSEVVSCTHPHLLREQQVDAGSQMVDELVIPMGEVDECP